MGGLFRLPFFLTSCQKEKDVLETEAISNHFRFEQTSVFSNLNNTEDQEDHHINACLFTAGKALVEELKSNKLHVNVLFDAYKFGETTVKIADVLPDKSINLKDNTGTFESLAALNESMTYKGVQYYTVLSLMNTKNTRDILNNKHTYIIALATEVNDEDAVPGWYINGDEVSEVNVLEQDLEGDIPIFIVQNATDHVELPKSDGISEWKGENNTPNDRTTGPITIDWDTYQIKNGHRYENTGKSELQYALTLYKPTTPYVDNSWVNILFNTYGIGYNFDRNIKNVKKSDISNSTIFTTNEWCIKNHPADLYDVHDAQFYITVYERDWAQSPKAVQACVGIIHNVKMKYSNEWYYVDYCGFSAKDSFLGASFSVSNTKCSLTLTRTL